MPGIDLALIFGKGKKPSDKSKESDEKDLDTGESEEVEMSEEDAAAGEILEAISEKDNKALAESLRSFVEICMNHSESYSKKDEE